MPPSSRLSPFLRSSLTLALVEDSEPRSGLAKHACDIIVGKNRVLTLSDGEFWVHLKATHIFLESSTVSSTPVGGTVECTVSDPHKHFALLLENAEGDLADRTTLDYSSGKWKLSLEMPRLTPTGAVTPAYASPPKSLLECEDLLDMKRPGDMIDLLSRARGIEPFFEPNETVAQVLEGIVEGAIAAAEAYTQEEMLDYDVEEVEVEEVVEEEIIEDVVKEPVAAPAAAPIEAVAAPAAAPATAAPTATPAPAAPTATPAAAAPTATPAPAAQPAHTPAQAPLTKSATTSPAPSDPASQGAAVEKATPSVTSAAQKIVSGAKASAKKVVDWILPPPPKRKRLSRRAA